jgi:hypothetical protein
MSNSSPRPRHRYGVIDRCLSSARLIIRAPHQRNDPGRAAGWCCRIGHMDELVHLTCSASGAGYTSAMMGKWHLGTQKVAPLREIALAVYLIHHSLA